VPNQQPDLLPHEQEAVAREIDVLLVGRTQAELGRLLGGLSQAAISKAKKTRTLGRDVADRVCAFLGTTLDALLEKHGLYPPLPPGVHPLEVAIAYHANFVGQEAIDRVRARARERVQVPRQWGKELVEEQQHLTGDPLTETTPPTGVSQLVPESSRRKRG
jgi:hypothetical protein